MSEDQNLERKIHLIVSVGSTSFFRSFNIVSNMSNSSHDGDDQYWSFESRLGWKGPFREIQMKQWLEKGRFPMCREKDVREIRVKRGDPDSSEQVRSIGSLGENPFLGHSKRRNLLESMMAPTEPAVRRPSYSTATRQPPPITFPQPPSYHLTHPTSTTAGISQSESSGKDLFLQAFLDKSRGGTTASEKRPPETTQPKRSNAFTMSMSEFKMKKFEEKKKKEESRDNVTSTQRKPHYRRSSLLRSPEGPRKKIHGTRGVHGILKSASGRHVVQRGVHL